MSENTQLKSVHLVSVMCPERLVTVDSYRSTIKLDVLHNLKLCVCVCVCVCRYFLNQRGVFQIGASHRMYISLRSTAFM
jgi:hypothetical protein